MNTVLLIGRLTRDPELSYTPSQVAMCTFTLAVDRPRRQGEQSEADFIRIVAWNRTAENCSKYLQKGRQCAVNGSIRTGSYTNREGQKVYTTDVWANTVEFIGGANGENSRSNGRNQPTQGNNYQPRENFAQNANYNGFDDLPSGFAQTQEDAPWES